MAPWSKFFKVLNGLEIGWNESAQLYGLCLPGWAEKYCLQIKNFTLECNPCWNVTGLGYWPAGRATKCVEYSRGAETCRWVVNLTELYTGVGEYFFGVYFVGAGV